MAGNRDNLEDFGAEFARSHEANYAGYYRDRPRLAELLGVPESAFRLSYSPLGSPAALFLDILIDGRIVEVGIVWDVDEEHDAPVLAVKVPNGPTRHFEASEGVEGIAYNRSALLRCAYKSANPNCIDFEQCSFEDCESEFMES